MGSSAARRGARGDRGGTGDDAPRPRLRHRAVRPGGDRSGRPRDGDRRRPGRRRPGHRRGAGGLVRRRGRAGASARGVRRGGRGAIAHARRRPGGGAGCGGASGGGRGGDGLGPGGGVRRPRVRRGARPWLGQRPPPRGPPITEPDPAPRGRRQAGLDVERIEEVVCPFDYADAEELLGPLFESASAGRSAAGPGRSSCGRPCSSAWSRTGPPRGLPAGERLPGAVAARRPSHPSVDGLS